MDKLLPVGSVVVLNNAPKSKIMISGYYIVDKKTNMGYQYSGVLLPAGIPNTNDFLLFNTMDIEKILFTGYQTDERIEQLNELSKKMV